MSELTFSTIDEFREFAKVYHSHWFDKDTMRFFWTRVGRPGCIYKGKYFITSEQFHNEMTGYTEPRLFTIRKVTCNDDNFDISTVGVFQEFKSSAAAVHHIKNCLN